MERENRISGRCFCGAVQIEVKGAPVAMGYCHCSSCREWSAAPVNAFTLWAPDDVVVTRGKEKLGSFARTPASIRRYCTACGGHVLTEHPTMGLTDVYAAIIPAFRFEPALHVNYQETVLRVRDGLPKQKDMPKEMGGSGIALDD